MAVETTVLPAGKFSVMAFQKEVDSQESEQKLRPDGIANPEGIKMIGRDSKSRPALPFTLYPLPFTLLPLTFTSG